ncbi:MAG: HIT family protein [Nonomuraea sp.]|nr:HIT family protein [Nonomuraea sp.]NUP67428.1 HIT family protein [Nonomuraea sp.]NUP76283.1 HIT family protein [Nonomuraea sp.]
MDLDRKVRLDLDAYETRVRSAPCFICAIVSEDPAYGLEQILYEDDDHLAFLARYPTMPGYTLVSPKRHVEHAVRDLDEDAYLAMMRVVRKVALAVESVVPSERTYVLSLGSQQGNSHLHWHVAPLPPGTPYREQQYHALMAENGLIEWSQAQAEELAARIRQALA